MIPTKMGLANRFLLAAALLVISLGAACSPRPQTGLNTTNTFYFEETGYTVRGEFYDFFLRYGGVESLGLPLSEEIIVDGWRVQYFEKGRLELHPENEADYRITVGWLGDLLHRRRPPAPTGLVPDANNSNRRYFAKTGHSLSGDFLHYFETNGGSVRFGLPISEPFLWQGRLTQDLQSARFFWSPEQTPPVTLEYIGAVHLKTIGLDDK